MKRKQIIVNYSKSLKSSEIEKIISYGNLLQEERII
jgi:hypothetical protein